MRHLVGIDEAGRGPLAGPVAVGVVIVPRDFDWHAVKGAKDSKQMTPTSREILYATMQKLRQEGKLHFAVAFSSASVIDKRGIVPAIRSALENALDQTTENSSLCEVRLDGGLRAPARFTNQTTIIRGDQSEPVISLASIAAKVERDRLMLRLAKKFPAYGFERHKGYGTVAHCAAIRTHGLSQVHRATFCTQLLLGSKSV